MTLADFDRTMLPGDKEVAAAVESRRQLAAFLSTKLETRRIEIMDDEQRPHELQVPVFALRLLDELLGELAMGNAVKIVPIHAELTTQEAADLLNVSRPYLVKLLDENVIPHTKVGRHRRVKFADLMAYKQRRDAESRQALDELAAQAQELGMGYE
ncbi:helix-turn-helix domain-containing protein [Azotobacter chroococcum]|uniref:Excisionase family DNA binding protein n=1 Tax=Azotobacter chroococcum TaxID=353 RepID=A0A4R1PSV2_9GAMM|nr:helix-turn-helix domain-containing protein [Azotobacter chroococcum]TBV98571.1 helix-turn-helix domain-containing protein [Azotobacter chroococcum]TCL34804.1 excisionase family DNA binding protein [Azotobacter chroococcum]